MDKAITGMVLAVIAIGVFAGVAQAMTPQAQYTCPICGALFYTYDELYRHFTTEHPSEQIDLIWE